jgi:hypothetical protein
VQRKKKGKKKRGLQYGCMLQHPQTRDKKHTYTHNIERERELVYVYVCVPSTTKKLESKTHQDIYIKTPCCISKNL